MAEEASPPWARSAVRRSFAVELDAEQILLPARLVVPGDVGGHRGEHLLAGLEVGRGERDLLEALAVDRHGAHDHVDLAVLDRGDALAGRNRPELDGVRVAQDVLGDRVDQIDVEALQVAAGLRVVRVAVAPVVAVLVDADDQSPVLAVLDGLDRRPVRARGAGLWFCGFCGSVHCAALAWVPRATPCPPAPVTPSPRAESGSSSARTRAVAQASAIAPTPPQPLRLARRRRVFIAAPPLTGTPKACGRRRAPRPRRPARRGPRRRPGGRSWRPGRRRPPAGTRSARA